MPNKEQQIIEPSISIDGDVSVNVIENGNELTEQIVDNTQLLNSILKQLKEINNTLKKIYK